MAYVNLTKDFSEVKKTVSGTGLTVRQIIGLALGLVIGFPVFLLFKNVFHTDTTTAVFALGISIVPVFLLVTWKKNGVYMEKHIKYFIETYFIRNTERPYKVENLYEMIEKEEKLKRNIEKVLFKGKSNMEIKSILENGKTQEFSVRQDRFPWKKKKIKIPLVGKIDRKTKKELERMVRKAKLKGEIPESAQDTIPYKVPYEDGIFESENGLFNVTIEFEDINYQLLDNDPKNTLFEWWCRLLNNFDYDVPFQFCYGNMEIDRSTYVNEVELKSKNDGCDRIRKEYSDMLIEQFSKSTNNLKKVRYLTFGVYAPDHEAAKVKLGKITKHLQKHFRRLQSKNHVLNGYERLELLYKIFHPATTDKLMWNWDMPVNTGLSSKDFIAPNSFTFKPGPGLNATKYFKVGDRIGAVSLIMIYATDMEDRIIADMLNHNGNLWLSIHSKSVPRSEAIKFAKDNLNKIQQMMVNAQKSASFGGWSMDIMSPELKVYNEAGEEFYYGVQRKDEQVYNSVITVVQTAKTRKELEAAIFDLKELLQPYQCEMRRLENEQERGYITSLPLCVNKLECSRTFRTTDIAVFIPYTTKELYSPDGQYYGMNSLSNNVIMVNKKKLVNPNSLTIGEPGYGKSFAEKREIFDVFLRTDDDILIIDPEGEYGDMVKILGGQYIKVSLNSDIHINPMEIDLDIDNTYDNDYDPVASKCGFVESMCELILGNNAQLSKKQLATIDRCCNRIYERYREDPDAPMPILEDLYNELSNMDENDLMRPIGIDLSIGLTRYVDGSLNYFNNQSNVDIRSRIVCFDLKDMQSSQKDLTMLIIQEIIWARVARNRKIGKYTRVYIDEFHLLLRNPKTASYCVEIWKRFRKWGGIPTGITQNVKDLFRSPEIQNILDTTNFIMMLNQNGDDAKLLAEHIDISDEEMTYIKSGEPGKGLLWVEEVKVPFEDDFPKDTLCYRVMTTKPGEKKEVTNE